MTAERMTPFAPYETTLAAGAPLHARLADGSRLPLPLGRWLGPPTREEERVLDRALGPVLDVGCGPGRHVLALQRRGVPALGVDVSAVAVRLARRRGAPAMVGSVFAALPGAGRWRTALLLDGNIGIGGDPAALLRRVAAVLAPGGRVLAEVERPGAPTRVELVRLECGGRLGAPFPWARVGVDGVASVAGDLRLHEAWRSGRRWFAELRRPG
ncbi:MAG TPA: class I SAM-dependent methyltransferase [Solirubrobacteraceae bacterium]|nr:class I SAM-dependent methyltransferase [Solirubrobacteraceae bacterium]